jgi:5-methylcytosine-specific restriction endonuclease McrA
MSKEKLKEVENPFDLTEKREQEKIEKKAEAKRRKELRNEITHKLRFDILERDKYTCQYCGKSPHGKRNNGEEVELVVDHIIPLDKGGTNDLKNLLLLVGNAMRVKRIEN